MENPVDLFVLLGILRVKVKECEKSLARYEKEVEEKRGIDLSSTSLSSETRALSLLASRVARSEEERIQEEAYRCVELVAGKTGKSAEDRASLSGQPILEDRLSELASRFGEVTEAVEAWSAWLEKLGSSLKGIPHDEV